MLGDEVLSSSEESESFLDYKILRTTVEEPSSLGFLVLRERDGVELAPRVLIYFRNFLDDFLLRSSGSCRV